MHRAIVRKLMRAGVLTTRVVRNVVADLRSGHLVAGEFLRRDATRESRYRANTDHLVLHEMFRNRVRDSDVLVDVGCGPGRVIGWWRRTYPQTRAVGIELNAVVAARARRRFRRDPGVRIVQGDAVEAMPSDGTLFYLFNPFDGPTAARFAERLRQVNPAYGSYRVLYHNPKHLDAFSDPTAWSIETFELPGSELAPFHPLAVVTPVGPSASG